jgi:hypothetical protein
MAAWREGSTREIAVTEVLLGGLLNADGDGNVVVIGIGGVHGAGA